MTYRRSISLHAIVAFLVLSCAHQMEEELQLRVERVENGMIPAVVVSGEEPPPVTIEEIMRHFGVTGVSVAVVNNGVLEWANGYGVLEAGGAEVNNGTLFLAGQISQAVAAMAALTMVEDGRISLDENVADRLESWHLPDNEFTTSEKVTLRRLLTHTSGLSARYFLGYLPEDSIPDLSQILDGVAPATNQPIRVVAEPGSGLHYSVGGYVVLQQLLKDLSGQQYSDFVHSSVLSPLGLENTTFAHPLPGNIVSNAATGHEPTNEQVRGRWRVYPELAAAGMWTTPSDLANLIIELQQTCAGRTGGVLTQLQACEMLTPQFESRGFGFEVGGDGDWRFFRLEGHGNNYLADLFAYVSKGMGAVVMTNSSNGDAVKAHILRAIATEYRWRDRLPEEVEVVALAYDALRELEGTYSFRGRDRVLRLESGQLLQSNDGGPDQELLVLTDSMLVSVPFGYRYGVERDETGQIIGLTLIANGTRLFTYERARPDF